MTTTELAADILDRNLGMIQMMLADFSDADMFVRPCPGANHAAWQLGHLCGAEAHLLNSVFPNVVPMPPESLGKYSKETSKIDDPKAFASKAALLEQLAKARHATVACVKSLNAADLSKPTPGQMANFCPTAGHIIFMLAEHVAMHVGQFQVIRRKLGKPVLF
jgi:hypothetical protein